jgi:hypothetical protein
MRTLLGFLTLLFYFSSSFANSPITQRIPQFSNDKVNVWQTIIFPSEKQKLTPHRHENDRVVVALDDGELQVTNEKGESHLLKLSKNNAYFLEKDVPGNLHTDINLTNHPIRVMVIELK